MEEENSTFLNSPVIQKITPIRRLGLSRKRKSCSPGYNLNAKIQICSEKNSENPNHSDNSLPMKKENDTSEDTENHENNLTINYDDEIESLKKRITESEQKLEALQCDKTKISQLEDLIELWRNGCKKAFLHFSQLLKEKQMENIDFKDVLSRLGIWETMLENFYDDPEISLSEYSEEKIPTH